MVTLNKSLNFSSTRACKLKSNQEDSKCSRCQWILGLLSAKVLLAPPPSASPLCLWRVVKHVAIFCLFADSPAKCAEPPFLSWEISLAKTAVTNNQRSLLTRPDYIPPYLSAGESTPGVLSADFARSKLSAFTPCSGCVCSSCVCWRSYFRNLVFGPVKFWMVLLSACCVAPGVEHSTNYLSVRPTHTHTYVAFLLSVCVTLNNMMITTDLVSERGTSPGNERNWWGELWAGCTVCKQITGWFGRDPLRAPQQSCQYVARKTSVSLMNYT